MDLDLILVLTKRHHKPLILSLHEPSVAMDQEADRQPDPLRIVKRSSNAPIHSSGDGAQDVGSDPELHPRRASAATEESMDSIQEDPGASQRSLSIPKKRMSLQARFDGGASRFYTASEAHAAGMARRRRNGTDSFGPGSDHEDIGSRENEYGAGGRYASVRMQYLRDGQRAGTFSPSWKPYSAPC